MIILTMVSPAGFLAFRRQFVGVLSTLSNIFQSVLILFLITSFDSSMQMKNIAVPRNCDLKSLYM